MKTITWHGLVHALCPPSCEAAYSMGIHWGLSASWEDCAATYAAWRQRCRQAKCEPMRATRKPSPTSGNAADI